MNSVTCCPDVKRWQEHLTGTLPPGEQATLIRHLDTCESCQQTLENLVVGPVWLDRTKQLVEKEDHSRSSNLAEVLEGLKKLDDPPPTNATEPETQDLGFLLPSQQPGHLGRLQHYEITAVLGRGGMGTVLKAIDEKLGRVVAIKVLSPLMASYPDSRRRFVREARAAAAVHHDNVVTIFAVEEAQGIPFLAMEFISGVSLQERLDRKPPLDVAQILRIGMQTAGGLAAAHAQGLIHRDIKPANLLLENGVERVKLTDFGLASSAGDTSLTREGIVVGTPEFMSPEQARGELIDHRADLFSLGSVLYAMCAGHPPFRANNPLATLRLVSEHVPPSLRTVNPRVPDWLVKIIEQLMAKDSRARLQSAKEVADLLGQHLTALQEAERTGRVDSNARNLGSRWMSLAVGALLLAFAAIVTWQFFRTPPPQPVVVKSANQAPSPNVPAVVDEQPAGAATAVSADSTSADQPASRPVPRVLVVIASRDFWYSDAAVVWSELRDGGIRVVTASTAPKAEPTPSQPGSEVTLDMLLSDVKAEDFDGIIFCGGRGISEYLGDSPGAKKARDLIHQMLAADRFVGAVSHAPAVLAEAGVLEGKQATCIKYEGGRYIEILKKGGAEWIDKPVVISGRIICGRGTSDAKTFTLTFLQSLKNRE